MIAWLRRAAAGPFSEEFRAVALFAAGIVAGVLVAFAGRF